MSPIRPSLPLRTSDFGPQCAAKADVDQPALTDFDLRVHAIERPATVRPRCHTSVQSCAVRRATNGASTSVSPGRPKRLDAATPSGPPSGQTRQAIAARCHHLGWLSSTSNSGSPIPPFERPVAFASIPDGDDLPALKEK
jgi:hypothetical protein